MEKSKEEELLDSLTFELRRGTIILGVLNQLKTPQYGYSLVILLQEKGITIDASTLYPLLRRLEKQGIRISTWDTGGSKPRKYYEMSQLGKSLFVKFCGVWTEINNTMNNLIGE